MQTCTNCNSSVIEGAAFCQYCGTPQREIEVGRRSLICPDCGARNPPATNFCHSCGRRIAEAARPADAPRGVETPAPYLVMPPATKSTASGHAAADARLIAVRRDGSDGEVYPLIGDQVDVGRSEGDLLFDDPHLAPRHARIAQRSGSFVLTPLEPRNGVYVRLHQPTELVDGDHFLIGKQVLRFEVLSDAEKTLRPAVEHGVVMFGTPAKAAWARLRQMTSAGTCRDVFHLTRTDLVVGREQGDIVFSDDEFLSRRHAQLQLRGGRVTLQDLGSSNGTFLRLRGPHPLVPGELIRMGDELLRFEIG